MAATKDDTVLISRDRRDSKTFDVYAPGNDGGGSWIEIKNDVSITELRSILNDLNLHPTDIAAVLYVTSSSNPWGAVKYFPNVTYQIREKIGRDNLGS